MTTGIVIYCDAGARPNPGHVGWGLHGYKYLLEEPKKGSGLPDQILTNEGYVTKSSFEEEKRKDPSIQVVTPIVYIDGYGSLNYTTTNNVGELTAAIEVLRWCREQPDLNRITILADSKYVVEGSNEHMAKWKAAGWIRQDRIPVANVELWKELDALLNHYRAVNIPVIINWVKAHNGLHGNELADHYATVAVMRAMSRNHLTCIDISEPEGYWKYNVDRHPFISHKGLLFNTLTDYQIPGQYYLSDNIREVDLLGKKTTDGAFAFVAISDPDPMLEMVRGHQSRLANDSDNLIIARLDFLYNPNNHKELMEFQSYAMYQKEPLRLDLYGLNKEPITRELRPAKLAIRAVESLSDLSERLDQFLLNDSKYTCTDITDIFFTVEETVKKKETVQQYKLRPEIAVGLTSVKVNAKYNVSGEVKEKPITLTLGVDLPGRNSIKHMEDIKPKIQLITWKESDKSFRYATVISTDKDRGIWAGVYSNLVIIKD